MQSLVSIITPSYNKQKFIAETIKSVIAQTHQNWELIIVDDNSTDNTAEIITQFSEQDKRVLLFQNRQNKGANFCRNFGLSKAKGDYVIFLDADDVLLPKCLETRIEKALKFSDSNLLVFSMGVFQKQIGDTKGKEWIPNTKTPLQGFLRDKLSWSILQSIWKKDFLLELNGFDEIFPKLQDVELHTRALLHPFIKLKIFPGITDCYYRIDDDRKNFNAKEFLLRRAKSAAMYCDKFEKNVTTELKKYLFGSILGAYTTILYYLRTKQITPQELYEIEKQLFSANIMQNANGVKKMLFKVFYFYNRFFIRIPGVNKILTRLIIL